MERKLHELIERLDRNDDAARSLSGSLPDPKVLALVVTDLDAAYSTELREGRMGPLREGHADEADIRITASSDDLVELLDGRPGGAVSAYLTGRLRVEAALSDLLRLRKLL
ncbi:MAG TPA: SCP2 sterol-binding domain-containing protein [Actinomycetota bacterium]|nr:SCP2 sterol-binding domain-containing protein [Actinomycetota bacterium]